MGGCRNWNRGFSLGVGANNGHGMSEWVDACEREEVGGGEDPTAMMLDDDDDDDDDGDDDDAADHL